MLFHGNDPLRLLRRLHQQLRIDRLDGMDIDHSGVHALSGQLLCRLQRSRYAQARGDDGQITAFSQGNALPNLKMVIRTVIDHRNRQAPEAQIDRPLISRRR